MVERVAALRGATFVYGGGSAAFAAVLLVVGLAWSRDEATNTALEVVFVDAPAVETVPVPAPAPPPPTPPTTSPTVTAAPARPVGGPDLSKPRSVEELRALAAEHPQDPSVLRALVEAEAHGGRPPPNASLDAVGNLIRLDPKGAASTDVLTLLKTAAAAAATREQALQLIPTLGEVGFDLLLELAGGTGPVKTRALELTKNPAVQARASASAKVFVKLRDAQVCARKAHLDEASQVGDARAVPLIKAMVQQTSCGFLGFEKCAVCRDAGPAAQKALKDIEARTGR
jgi:hypothetical protein